jgi:hypothetical protein
MRDLSSGFTPFAKFIVPPLWIAGVGWAALQLLYHPESVVFRGVQGGAPMIARWASVVVWLVGSVAIVRHAIRLKRVRLDGDSLQISNYFTEIRVPLEALVDVHQAGWLNPLITLEIADPNPFDGIVQFHSARPNGMLVWRDDAIVAELRRLAHLDTSLPNPRAV